jgi:opacity protein-like surface antigen
MMTTTRTAAAALILAAVLAPRTAHADWHVTSSLAGQFGGASRSIGASGSETPAPWSIGIAAGWQQAWVAAEGELAYAPRFFDDSGGFVARRSLTTVMGNVKVMMPAVRIQPFAVAGAGWIRPVIAEPGGLAEVDESLFGWNAGGGVRTAVAPRVAVQADIRYFRARAGSDPNAFGIDLDGLDFWRTSAGIAFLW